MSLGYKKLSGKCEKSHASKSKKDCVYYITNSDEKNDAIKMIDNLKKRKKRLVIFLIIIFLSLLSIILFGTLCADEVCALSISLNRKKLFAEHHSSNNINQHHENISSSLISKNSHLLSYDDVLNDDFQNKFDINSNDVMVILCNLFIRLYACFLQNETSSYFLFLFPS